MSIVRRLLCLGIVIVLSLVPAATAQEDSFEVEWLEDEDAIEVDGQLDESVWQGASQSQVEMGSDDGQENFAQLYLAHNGSALFVAVVSEGAEEVTVQIDAGGGAGTFGTGVDAIGTGSSGEVTDLHWDRDAERFVEDASVEDCGTNGTAARSDSDPVTVEFAQPFTGDDCDAFIDSGRTISMRLVVQTADATYQWPAGSAEGDTQGWATVTLLDRFGEAGDPIARGPADTPHDPGRETDEEAPGVDPNAPPAPGVDTDNPAYNAESERETPGLGWTLFALVGLAGLGLIAGLRRTR